jgi:dTDP-4-amino-4,6-dideoxygalactose transaminase
VPIVHEKRNAIVKELMDNDIEVRPLIAGNMANKPMWKERYSKPSLPNAELLEAQGFYVPNHQDLTIVDIEKITNIINKYE